MPSVVLPCPSPSGPDCRPRPTTTGTHGPRALTAAWWDGWVRYAADPAHWSPR